MEADNAQSEGRTKEMVDEDKELDEDRLSTEDAVSTNLEKVSTDFEKVSTDKPLVSTDGSKVSTDEQRVGTEDQTKEEIDTQASQTSTLTPTSVIFGDDETIATLLINMSKAKATSKEKEKGVELKDVEEIDRPRPTSTRSLLTLKPLPKIDPKDKGKKKIEEDDESENIILAEKLQEQEREQFTIEERAKFLHDTIAAQRKFLAQQRSEAIRNRPPTKNQLRNQMMTFLKHVGNFKHSELKKKMIKRMNIENIPPKEKRSSRNLKKKSRKKIKMKRVPEKKTAPDEDKEVDYEILDRKYPIIDWKTECLGTKPQPYQNEPLEEINLNVVTRSNGQKRYFSTLMTVLSIFDREDLNAMYQLVIDKYQDEMPEGFERVLWGDLMVLFKPNEQDEFWNSQHEWKVVSWKLHTSSGAKELASPQANGL
ncbi:hypothetical protein Tco_1322287, partial [Tanacetum coccineum]